MATRTSDFPFTIMDVVELLRLHIRRRSPDYIYADCPLCGSQRGKLCINLTKNAWCSNCCGDSGGMLALYAKAQNVSNATAYSEICDALLMGGFAPDREAKRQERLQKEAVLSERAPTQVLHQTYSTLLGLLLLTPAHRKHLQEKRGFNDEQIATLGFKSTPPSYLCRSLTAKLIQLGCTVQGVPGFYMDDNGKWTVKFHQRTSGILIPYRNLDGMIQGLQIRLDRPLKKEGDPPDKGGAKYLWLASTSKTFGVSSGSPVHFVGDPCSRVVYVTEGALKADIAHVLMNRTFAATGGAGCVTQLDSLFESLRRNGTEEIIEAEDMDKYSNKGVSQGASKLYLLAKKHGLSCRRLTWNPNYKGIDDWQLALHRKNKTKEVTDMAFKRMTFKERYQCGLCDLSAIDAFIQEWEEAKDCTIPLREYLGLTDFEYAAFLQGGENEAFRQMMDSGRMCQRFRIYQLNLQSGKIIPFAFSGIDELRKAGYEQPPASEYCLVYDGSMMCPQTQSAFDLLERILDCYNDDLPADYHGRSVSISDVVELYDDENRTYYYCDTAGFVPVKFSPMLAKKGLPTGSKKSNGVE